VEQGVDEQDSLPHGRIGQRLVLLNRLLLRRQAQFGCERAPAAQSRRFITCNSR
jgi:hypothetical protein